MANDLPDFLADFEEEEPSYQLPTTHRKNLADPLQKVAQSDIRKAKDPQGREPSMAGKQLRRGVLIPPEMDEEINQLVKKYKIGKMELMRYLLASGLEQIHKHGIEHNIVETRAIKLALPKWKKGK